MALSRHTCALRSASKATGLTAVAARLRRGWGLATLLVGLALFSSGCLSLYDPEASQEQNNGVIATVREDQAVGQTFVSRRPGLNGIGLKLGLALDSRSREGTR